MPTLKVGDIQFDHVTAAPEPPPLADAAEVLERDGIDAHEAILRGQRGQIFTWRECTAWDSSSANAITHQAAVYALRGTIVDVYDAYGAAHTSVLVREIRAAGPIRAVVKSGSTQYQTVYDIEMQRVT